MKFSSIIRRDPGVWAIAVLTGLLHLAFNGRYDIFRNELYYIVCGRHPAFGYADQPPLVPLIAAATQVFGVNVWLLRLPAALAAAALVPITARFARLLGGGGSACVIAALSVSISPALIALTQILTTATFEPLAWTVFAFLIAQAAVKHERRVLLWAGAVAGIALQAKYGIAFWIAGLGIGVLLFPGRALLASRYCWLGMALAAVIAAPSLVWQEWHGWPFLQVMKFHTDHHTNFTGTPIHYEIGQVFAMNLVLAPVWIAGLIAPFVVRDLRAARFIPVGYCIAAALIIAGSGKDYYLFPAYPALFAIGAVAIARVSRWVIVPWMSLATANTAFIAPVVFPILSPPALAAFLDKTHLRPKPDEIAAVGAPLTQVFSDELGWRDLEKAVARVYQSLPPEDRSRAAIVTSNYGEAAAIDVYGRADNLPPALSGQDQYYFWGPRGYDGAVVIHINGDVDRWRRNCASLEVVASFGGPFVMPYENARPIFVCRGIRVGLKEAWPYFKRFF